MRSLVAIPLAAIALFASPTWAAVTAVPVHLVSLRLHLANVEREPTAIAVPDGLNFKDRKVVSDHFPGARAELVHHAAARVPMETPYDLEFQEDDADYAFIASDRGVPVLMVMVKIDGEVLPPIRTRCTRSGGSVSIVVGSPSREGIAYLIHLDIGAWTE